MATEETTIVAVGFNQQQRELIERLKREKSYGETEGEIIHAVFAAWIRQAGLIA